MPLIEKKVVHLLLTSQKRFIVFFMLFNSLMKCISIWHSSFEIISKLIYFLNCKNEFLVLVRNVNGVPLAFNIFFRDFFLLMNDTNFESYAGDNTNGETPVSESPF